MIDFEIWWNSADADVFRSRHEESSGDEFKPVWDAAILAGRMSAENRPAQDDVRIAALKEARHIVYMAESLDHAFARIDAAIASQSAKEPKK